MVIFDNPATVPAPAGGYSHVARVELGDRTLLQLSGQVAIDADGKVRAARFTGTPPTITTVEVSRLWVPGALLEVEVLAIT